ncbi:MAG: hypothetical protein HC905_23255 [Bacteroidales bacterium]|nr:hypothetical protein [Bacteroidales bacterium]
MKKLLIIPFLLLQLGLTHGQFYNGLHMTFGKTGFSITAFIGNTLDIPSSIPISTNMAKNLPFTPNGLPIRK